MYSKDRKAAFSNEGFRVRRLNPDGTYPTPINHIGYVGTVDVDSLVGTETLLYRENAQGDFTSIIVDISAAGADQEAVDVDEMVTALNADGNFTAIFTASKDDNGRLKVVLDDTTNVDYLELKGDIAEVLGFGQSGSTAAMGTAFSACFDESAAISLPLNVKDFEEIEKESGRGQVDTMIIDAMIKGMNPSIVMNDERYEMKQIIQGGSWDETTFTYTPPTTRQTRMPICAAEVFVAKYGQGTLHRGDLSGYKMYDIKHLVGRSGDLSHDVKSWATTQFECRVSEYVDTDGVTRPGWTERELTIEQFLAMGLV